MRTTLSLLAVALVANPCGNADRVALLETEKRQLLETTVEKPVFWAEVERKGAAAKRKTELEEELAALQGQLAEQDARAAALQAPVGQARDTNHKAEDVKTELARREKELAEAVAELEQTVERWRAQGPEGAGRG